MTDDPQERPGQARLEEREGESQGIGGAQGGDELGDHRVEARGVAAELAQNKLSGKLRYSRSFHSRTLRERPTLQIEHPLAQMERASIFP